MDFDEDNRDDQPDIKKHRTLILETKLEILKRLARGECGATLAKQYGVSKSTVSEIKRKRDVLLEYTSNLRVENGLKKRKTIRSASNIALEETVYRWFLERREAGDPISGPLICQKALETNSELNGSPEFKASSGWLKNFKSRHNIKMQDLIIADITARVARKKLKEQCGDKVGEFNGEFQCSDSVVTISPSDSEMDSQLSCDRTSLVDPEQEISDAVSSILQSPEHPISDNDDQEYSVLFPTVTTVLSSSDQENSNSIGEYTEPYFALLHSPDQENSGIEEDPHLEVVHQPDQGHPEPVRDLHPEVVLLSDNEPEEPPAAQDSHSVELPAAAEDSHPEQPPVAAEDSLPEEPPVAAEDSCPEEPPVAAEDSHPEEPPRAAEDSCPEEPPVAAEDSLPEEPPVAAEDSCPEEPPVAAEDSHPEEPPRAAEDSCPEEPPVAAEDSHPERPPAAAEDSHPERPPAAAEDSHPEEPPAAAEDTHPETPVTYLSDNKNSESVEEGCTVSSPLIKASPSSPDLNNSDNLEGRHTDHTDSYPITSILPDPVNSDAVKEKVVPFITVKTDLLAPNHSYSVERCAVPYAKVRTDLLSPNESNSVQSCSDSYPVTSILPDLDNTGSTDVNHRIPVKIEIKDEHPDVVDGDHMSEEDSGPSDRDALIALDTAINWLERQSDKNPSHLSTLRSIREYAIYKERLSSHPLVPNLLIP